MQVFNGNFLNFHIFICFVMIDLGFNLPERRQAEANRIREKYPERIPVRISLYLRSYIFYILQLDFDPNANVSRR